MSRQFLFRWVSEIFYASLFLDEGHAVGAGILGRIHFMGADSNAGEAAVVFVAAMVAAVRNITFD